MTPSHRLYLLVDEAVVRAGRVLTRLPRPVRYALAGTVIAIGMATAYSLWVGLLVLLRGSPYLAEYDVYAGRVVGAYYQAALFAGPLCGLLWTWVRSGTSTFLVGTLGGTIAYAAIGRVLPDATGTPTWFPLMLGVLVGGSAALWIRQEHVAWCPSRRTIRLWWFATILGVPVSWLIGVTWRPSELVAVMAMSGFLAIVLVVTIVTLIRMGASAEVRHSADMGNDASGSNG